MLTCFDVANYMLAQADEDAGDLISNLKLQKLVYYAQGFNLAIFDEPLFNEVIEAWTHGPVVPALYHSYKEHSSAPIPVPENIEFEKYDAPVHELLNEVYSVFGQFSAWKLRNMTHEEAPWVDVSQDAGVITHKALRDYFITQLA